MLTPRPRYAPKLARVAFGILRSLGLPLVPLDQSFSRFYTETRAEEDAYTPAPLRSKNGTRTVALSAVAVSVSVHLHGKIAEVFQCHCRDVRLGKKLCSVPAELVLSRTAASVRTGCKLEVITHYGKYHPPHLRTYEVFEPTPVYHTVNGRII